MLGSNAGEAVALRCAPCDLLAGDTGSSGRGVGLRRFAPNPTYRGRCTGGPGGRRHRQKTGGSLPNRPLEWHLRAHGMPGSAQELVVGVGGGRVLVGCRITALCA